MTDQSPRDLPTGWVAARIEKICEIASGQTPKGIAELLVEAGDVPWFRVGDMNTLGNERRMEISSDWLSQADVASLGLHVRPPGTIIFPKRGGAIKTNKKRLLVRPSAYDLNTMGCIPFAGIGEFLWFWFQQLNLGSLSDGSNVPQINHGDIAPLVVPVAPLPEQRRIVEAIETNFTKLDAAEATLKRVQANLKRYRASVLKAAVEGTLVPTEAELARQENRDYELADRLLERILTERRRRWEEAELAKLKAKGKPPKNDKWKKKYKEPTPPDTTNLPDLPQGWCWTSMDHFLADIQAGKSFRCDERPPAEDEVGLVKVSAVTWGTFDPSESKTVEDPAKVNPDYFIQPGDFLFSRANTIELVGACVIAGSFPGDLMLSDKILRFDIAGGVHEWLLWNLRSLFGRSEIERLATGNQASMRNIGQSRIRQIRVPLPPQAEMQRILASLQSQIDVGERVGLTVASSVGRCSRLRQSILKQAFEGKLVPQDPDDEPASVLLERIKAEREAMQAKQKKTRRPRKKAARQKTKTQSRKS